MEPNDTPHSGYVDKVREETQRYVHKLLTENEALHVLVATQQTENERLRRELRQHETEEAQVRERLDEIRAESSRYAAQFVELETHNANLANLYVASYQLHGTLDRAAVLAVIQEIVVNLIGSEEFGIYEIAEDKLLRPLTTVGTITDHALAASRVMTRTVETGELYLGAAGAGPVTACIPMKLDSRVTGVITVFSLLPHKKALEPLDHELFDLLATHAATALHCTALDERLRNGEIP